MSGMWEKVKWPVFFRHISLRLKHLQIPRQSFRITGHINPLLWLHDRYSLDKLFSAAAPRRIHEHYIYVFAISCHVDHKTPGIVVIELDIFHLVGFGVFHGITDSILV